jgi:hypothetical protein
MKSLAGWRFVLGVIINDLGSRVFSIARVAGMI